LQDDLFAAATSLAALSGVAGPVNMGRGVTSRSTLTNQNQHGRFDRAPYRKPELKVLGVTETRSGPNPDPLELDTFLSPTPIATS
jgi:hypothetical protein